MKLLLRGMHILLVISRQRQLFLPYVGAEVLHAKCRDLCESLRRLKRDTFGVGPRSNFLRLRKDL